MKYLKILFGLLWAFPVLGQTDSIFQTVPLSAYSTQITHWNGEKYVPVFLKGINLEGSLSGTFRGQLTTTEDDYRQWFVQMDEVGYCSIRVYTLHYSPFFTLLDPFNNAHLKNPLYFLEGVWLEEEIPNYDYDLLSLDFYFSAEMKANKIEMVGKFMTPYLVKSPDKDFIKVQSNNTFTYWPVIEANGIDTMEYVLNTTYGSSQSSFAYFKL